MAKAEYFQNRPSRVCLNFISNCLQIPFLFLNFALVDLEANPYACALILYHSRKDLLLEYFQNILFQFEIDFMLSLSPEVKYKRLKRRFIKITVLYSFVCG